MPETVWLSMICEAFTCTPDVAKRLDPNDVIPIMEVRAAQEAIRQRDSDLAGLSKVQGLLLQEMAGTAGSEGATAPDEDLAWLAEFNA